jgi:23S rRNA pseudouridine2605 synthase
VPPAERREPAETAPRPAGSPVRINRFLSICGIASRRKAEDLVTEGRVTINGITISDLATIVVPGKDRVFVDGKEVAQVDAPIYLVLNKPKDTITTMADERGRPTVMDHVHARKRVFPIGRLDRKTTGILLLTNDGAFAHHLMHPRFGVPKAYRVTCSEAVTREHLKALSEGVDLTEGRTSPAEVFSIPGGRGREIGVTIHEGWNRQVRRMFEYFGYDVRKLDRVAYGPVTTEGLPRGATRPLTPQEIRKLKALAGIEE